MGYLNCELSVLCWKKTVCLWVRFVDRKWLFLPHHDLINKSDSKTLSDKCPLHYQPTLLYMWPCCKCGCCVSNVCCHNRGTIFAFIQCLNGPFKFVCISNWKSSDITHYEGRAGRPIGLPDSHRKSIQTSSQSAGIPKHIHWNCS